MPAEGLFLTAPALLLLDALVPGTPADTTASLGFGRASLAAFRSCDLRFACLFSSSGRTRAQNCQHRCARAASASTLTTYHPRV